MSSINLNELRSDVEDALEDLDFDYSDIESYYDTVSDGTKYACVDVTFDYDSINESGSDNYQDEAEDALSDVIDDWDAGIDWDMNTMTLAVEC